MKKTFRRTEMIIETHEIRTITFADGQAVVLKDDALGEHAADLSMGRARAASLGETEPADTVSVPIKD